MSPRVRGGLRLCEAMTRRPQAIDAALVEELRDAGLDDVALEDAANVAFHFNFINRIADAFAFPLLEPGPRRRLAKALDRAGRLLAGARPEPSFARGDDGVVRPIQVDEGRAHVLRCDGITAPALRREVEAYAAGHFGAGRRTVALPEPLFAYVDKLTRWAYRIVDEDVDALKAAGYSEEAIFELTFVGAFGAAVGGVERLFGALYGEAAGADAAAE